jgi:predicted DNA-binding protein with PD1-like motif
MIQSAQYQLGRVFLGRLPAEGDVIGALTEFCQQQGIRAGWISAIGTVRQAEVGYFDHQRGEYLHIEVAQFMEIVSCQGNVSLKDGQAFVHLHIILSDAEGQTVAGHLFDSTVFVGEFHLQEVLGPDLVRKPDAASGLSLWELP